MLKGGYHGYADVSMHTNDARCSMKFTQIDGLPMHQLIITSLMLLVNQLKILVLHISGASLKGHSLERTYPSRKDIKSLQQVP